MEREKINIYLDDVRIPIGDKWTVVRSYDEFVALINLKGFENIDVVSLDHDLGISAITEYYKNVKPNKFLDYSNINEKTGYDAAKFLVAESIAKKIMMPQVYVHSANPIGSENIISYINNYLMVSNLPQTCVRVKIEHILDEKIEAERVKYFDDLESDN